MGIFDNNGLIVLPAGIKTSKIYAARPINGDGDLIFTNPSVRTRLNRNGVLETVVAQRPRLYFEGGKPRIMMEPQATNLVTYPISLVRNYWSKGQSVVIANANTAGSELWNMTNVTVNTPWVNNGNGEFSIDGSQTAYRNIIKANALIVGKTYRVDVTVTAFTAGILQVKCGNEFRNVNANGSYSVFLQADATYFSFTADPDFAATIGGISLKEVNAYLDPLNTTNSYKINDNTDNNAHYIYKSMAVTNGQTYTASFYAKAGERSIVYFAESLSRFTYFNLTTGIVGTKNAAHTASIELINGFYRCSVTFIANTTSINLCLGLSTADNTYLYSGNGTSGAYFYGVQFCQNEYKTSFIYDGTEGATKTRAIDQVSLIGLWDKNIVSDTWSVIVDLYSFATPTAYAYCIALRTGADKQVSLGISSTGKFVVKDEKNGKFPWPDASGISAPGKICMVWDGSQLKLIANGVINATLYTPVNNFTEVDNLEWIGGAPHQVNALVILPYALSDSQAIQLTQ